MLKVPEVLSMPDKMKPIIKEFNNYRYFLLEGGRGGGKTHGIARLLSYVAEKKTVRIYCGREIQKTIEESVYTVFKDVITDHRLNFNVQRDKIEHNTTESTVSFKGFRDLGAASIKGMEGVDILWIDEAQAITKRTLDIILPTIRKQKAKVFFSMNRHLKNDPVYKEFYGDPECLHIKINYYDNPFCSQALIDLAEKCKRNAPDDYRHIWLGEPLADADNYLFSDEMIEASYDRTFPYDPDLYEGKLFGGDVARFGNNYSSNIVIKQVGPNHWEEFHHDRWLKHDAIFTTGKFTETISTFKPHHSTVDADGLGGPVVDYMRGSRMAIHAFHGGSTENLDKNIYKNWRTYGYLFLYKLFSEGKIRLKSKFIGEQLKEIIYRYDVSNRKYIIPKEELIEKARNKGVHYDSPDDADALMMAASQIRAFENEQKHNYGVVHGRVRRPQSNTYSEENLI